MNFVQKGQAFEERFSGGMIWTVVLTGATGLSALLMFLVHVVAVRLLETEQYGEFASAIALVGIVGVASSSVQAATVQKVKNAESSREILISPIVENLVLLALSATLGILAFWLVGVSTSTAILLAMWVPAAVMIARANGEIQGREIQTILHGSTTIIAAATLTLSAVLLFLWTDVESLLIARLVITISFALYLLRATGVPVKSSLRFINKRLIHTTILVTSMWFAANMDVLLSRTALGETENGEIAIAAMLVNSVLLIPGLIAAVIYPKAIEMRNHRKKEMRLLIQAILLSGAVQLTLAILLSVLASFLVNWLAGPGHTTAIDVITPLSMAYIPLGISIVVSQFVLALGNLRQSVLFMLSTVFASMVLLNASSSAVQFVNVLLTLSSVLFLILTSMAIFLIVKIKNA
jgi:O-antigen/teichoic acid export membrane protein